MSRLEHLDSDNRCMLIAISGGIGSGKSMVCRVLRCMGYDVYDCDSEAKRLMDASNSMKSAIARDICADVIIGSKIDRKRLAEIVFSDSMMLDRLNTIVHSEVRSDILSWSANKQIAFVETAILYQSGLDKLVNEVWEVTAPNALRVRRVMLRNGMSAEEVQRRINAQEDFEPESTHRCVKFIENDDLKPLLPRIIDCLNVLAVCGGNTQSVND